MPDPDALLMLKFRAGETEAFTEIVKRHQRALVRFFFGLVWDRHAAEDLAQEVFVRLYTHAAHYEPKAKFTTYLYRVARNLWIDRVRSQAVHPRPASLDRKLGGDSDDEATLGDSIGAARTPSPVDTAVQAETRMRLRKAIESLPDEMRDVLFLAETQGLRYEEIGEILEIPVGTVKSRVHAAVGRLREILGSGGGNE